MRLQTKVTVSVGLLIGLAAASVSTVGVLIGLEQGIRQSEKGLAQIALAISQSDDPISTALFEGSTRELTAVYIDEFGIQSYLQENAGELGSGNQVIQTISIGSSESITLAVSTEAYYASALATLVPLAATTLAVVGLATLITHLLLRRDISSINHLIRQSRTISQGGPRELSKLNGSWEVETLSESLTRMVSTLDENQNALKKFLSDASHELKTPLTVVRGYLDMLARGEATNGEVLAQKALNQSIRMQKIIDDLLDLAEVTGTKMEMEHPIELSRLLTEAFDDLQSLSPDFEFAIEIEEDVVIDGNQEQIQKLLSNLIGNVYSHVPNGSQVAIRLKRSSQFVSMTIEDSGPGFPDDILDSTGQPVRFRKGANKPGSTGLGLSLIFEVVSAHGATIELGRSLLGGAKVDISFPVRD